MKINLPPRNRIPSTSLYVELINNPNINCQSRKTILLVPGGPGGNHSVFSGIKEDLLQHGDLLLFDPRGCGYSDPSNVEYCSLEYYIDDIEAIRKYFNLSKITLLGGSYGSMASLGYAIKYGDNLDNLVLIAGAPSSDFLETAKYNLKERGTHEQIEVAKDLFAGSFKSPEHFAKYYTLTASLYLVNQSKASRVPTLTSNLPYNIEITNFGFSKFLREFDFKKDLKKIKCRTLVIVGDKDWINDPVHSKFVASNISNAKLVILNDCGHFAWEDNKKDFFAALNSFFKFDIN